MKDLNEESRKFWEQREKQKGGKVGFFTFAMFIGRSREKPINTGGLLYTIDDRVYFEDFEKENWLYKLFSRNQKFEKTELSFDKENIAEIKTISKSNALNCIQGYIDDTETKPLVNFLKIFFQPVYQIRLTKGYSLFFDIMNKKEFLKAVTPSI